jgi:iron complex outermembrane receptor protein/hemoglobin/transferrin/lactoferrin receptor protein
VAYAAALFGLTLPCTAPAEAVPPPETGGTPPTTVTPAATPGSESPTYEAVVVGEPADATPMLAGDRATSTVSRADLERRLPRSAPDALRYEPGVFVQQTAHSQGSAFIRGLTGQQTLILFDGIRLNNSTFRQGPNQYFFTLDSQSISRIEIMRGGGSTRWGSDALGGVILAHSLAPSFRPAGEESGFSAAPRLFARGATADRELGGRVESNLALGSALAFVGGVGGRQIGRLEGGGVLRGLAGDNPASVPRLGADGRTQLGTGFDELTADGRLAYRLGADQELTFAAYLYRQYDAPRTDQCPAPFAPRDECLSYDEQFRTLVYGAWTARHLGGFARTARATLSWQRQHERRRLRRPSVNVVHLGRDDVDTLGVTVALETAAWRPQPWLRLSLGYGADGYFDRVASAAWIRFTDIDHVEPRSRGQYLDGSTYSNGGAFGEVEARLWQALILRLGARLAAVVASAPADDASGSRAVDQTWVPWTGHLGAEWRAHERLSLLAHADRSFRAPNLDDLTSRQQTGPGFQFENPALGPESAHTLELGARLHGRLQVDLWAFSTAIDGALSKSPREVRDCPPNTPQCASAWSRLQLVNARRPARLFGLEGAVQASLPGPVALRATIAYARGDGPNPTPRPTDPSLPHRRRVPLSRIPPLNGTGELTFGGADGLEAGIAARWALAQDRLAVSDLADARIPPGGTPGFIVVDLRAGYRFDQRLSLILVLENLFDAAYRYHGSSVNGPGRGLMALLSAGL